MDAAVQGKLRQSCAVIVSLKKAYPLSLRLGKALTGQGLRFGSAQLIESAGRPRNRIGTSHRPAQTIKPNRE